MAGELAEHHLPARHGIGEQQRHRAAIHLADDRVVGQQQRDQRHEKDRQAGEADDGDSERADLDRAGGRGAEKGERERQRRKKRGRRDDPAIAHAVAQFLAGDDQDLFR